MVFIATFNNISVSFIGGGNRSTRINHRPTASHPQQLLTIESRSHVMF
jgi:hypothetical protein